MNGIIINSDIYKAVPVSGTPSCEQCDLYMEHCKGGNKRFCLPFGNVIMQHQPVIDVTPSKDRKKYCGLCGRAYDPADSDAELKGIFCCKACEYGY